MEKLVGNVTSRVYVTNTSIMVSSFPETDTHVEHNISIEELYQYIFPQTLEWILISVYVLTYGVGVVGNVLVCFAVWTNSDLRTVTNIFIVNLSIADLLILNFVLPSVLLVDVTTTWFIGTIPCKLHVFLATLTISVSVLTLCAISVERWYAICHPLRFRSTVKRARYIIAVIWLSSSCIALPELITSTVIPLRSDTVLFSACYPALLNDNGIVIFQIVLLVGLYFLPLLLMTLSYINIALVLCRGTLPGNIEIRSGKTMLNGQMRVHENVCRSENRRKAVRMLVAVVTVFALCFLPNHILNLIRYSGHLDEVPNKRLFALIAHWATFLNSCINPVIYNFMSAKFKKAFKVAAHGCFHCCRARRNWQRQNPCRVTFSGSRSIGIRLSNV